MSDTWDERRRAQEDGYFENLNKQALSRLAAKQGTPARKSPVTGKPMEHLAVMGVVIDRCVDSGGVWLDAGELTHILEAAKDSSASLGDFISAMPALIPQSSAVTEGLKSPITEKPMNVEQVLGVTVALCAESGGVWLDATELDKLIKSSHQTLSSGVKEFFRLLLGKK
ncbi:MAG: Transcription factor zinc-finger [Pseudomonadota bacterium]|jgi:Zn-finger nucleic acid-binding protein